MARHAESPPRPLAGADFQRELENESLRAKRGRCPLSLVLFAPTLQNAPGKEAEARQVLRCIQTHASPCDSLGLLPELRYALVLPGAGVFKAQTLTEDILQSIVHAGIRCAAGIASAELPENACADTLLQQAITALHQVREQSGTIRVYRDQTESLSLRKTLVHSHEKRFLFSGET